MPRETGIEGGTAEDVSHEPFDDSHCPHADVIRNCHNGWCDVPAGCFVMGSPEWEWGRGLRDEDQIAVTLTHSFSIQATEVTQAQWTAAGFANPSGKMKDGTGDCLDSPDCPVGNVTWFDAVAFANRLSENQGLPACYKVAGCSTEAGQGMICSSVELTTASIYDCQGIRLPTEAEWEYAVRAGTRSAFYSGDITVYPVRGDCEHDANLESIAWFCINAGPATHAVGQKAPNAWGLYDMSGNAAEWTNERYRSITPTGPLTDPGAALDNAPTRVVRGGLFNLWSTVCRSASKDQISPGERGPGLGFRLARSLP
jgi:formylglycine-generating enzyme required for sulfatase activity